MYVWAKIIPYLRFLLFPLAELLPSSPIPYHLHCYVSISITRPLSSPIVMVTEPHDRGVQCIQFTIVPYTARRYRCKEGLNRDAEKKHGWSQLCSNKCSADV